MVGNEEKYLNHVYLTLFIKVLLNYCRRFSKEFDKTAIYINLGGFRDEKTDDYQTEDVISAINNLVKSDYKNSVYNLMSKMDESKYL